MINAGFVDFAFTGVAIVPEVLLFAEYVGEAMLLLIPMLIGACLLSMYYEHVIADDAGAPADQLSLGGDDLLDGRNPRKV